MVVVAPTPFNFSNATSASTINLSTGVVTGYATDTISNFTKIVGSNLGDTITGSAGNDSITGGTATICLMRPLAMTRMWVAVG